MMEFRKLTKTNCVSARANLHRTMLLWNSISRRCMILRFFVRLKITLFFDTASFFVLPMNSLVYHPRIFFFFFFFFFFRRISYGSNSSLYWTRPLNLLTRDQVPRTQMP